jgi:mRNA interferase HigB
MRIVAHRHLREFGQRHPSAARPLVFWHDTVRASTWQSMQDVRRSFSKAKILNGERARFEISGGDFRLIVAFDFQNQIAYIKFIGTHAEYDVVDALTVSMF